VPATRPALPVQSRTRKTIRCVINAHLSEGPKRGCVYDVAPSVGCGASPACEITLPDGRRTDIFYGAKAQGRQFALEFVGFKVVLEGLSHGSNTRSKRLVSHGALALVGTRSRGIEVVEHDVCATGQVGDEPQRRKDGPLRQIRHDAQPGEERLFGGIEARGDQAFFQSLPLEIDWSEGKRGRNLDCRFVEPLALPRLSCRVIDLVDTQGSSQGCAVGIGVETCPEQHHLPDTASNGNLQGTLGKARSYGDKQAQSSLGRVFPGIANRPLRVNSQDAQGQWIAEDRTVFQYLMSSTVKGSAQCGPARLSWLHEKSLACVAGET